MSPKYASVALSVLGFATAAQAFPTLSMDTIARAMLSANRKAPRAVVSCPNLSGNWSGTCQAPGQAPTASTTSISQIGCLAVASDGQTLVIGGLQGQDSAFVYTDASSGSTTPVASHEVLSADWSTDGSALEFNEAIDARALGADSSFEDIIQERVALAGNQLQVTASDAGGLIKNLTCLYDRQ